MNGKTLVIDELDSRLHPELTDPDAVFQKGKDGTLKPKRTNSDNGRTTNCGYGHYHRSRRS